MSVNEEFHDCYFPTTCNSKFSEIIARFELHVTGLINLLHSTLDY